MNKAWPMAEWIFLALAGATLLFRAKNLSVAYNAWTTSLRQRSFSFNPPTDEMRKVNTRIMKWMFRVLGAFLLLLSTMAVIGVWNSH